MNEVDTGFNVATGLISRNPARSETFVVPPLGGQAYAVETG